MKTSKENLAEVYSDYFGLTVPDIILENILKDDEIRIEAETRGIRDTCQIDVAINALTNLIGCGYWPINGDTQQYKDWWEKDFLSKCWQNNIGVTW